MIINYVFTMELLRASTMYMTSRHCNDTFMVDLGGRCKISKPTTPERFAIF